MKAIRFNVTITRYAAGLVLGKVSPRLLWSGLSCTYANDSPPPALPGDDWVRVATRYGGICGSDLGAIHLHTSPYLSPFVSFPYTFGHENVGVIAEAGPAVKGWQPGQRVVTEPTLWCEPRGIEPRCRNCAQGEINRCLCFTEGKLAPGLFIGACRDTGGSWSESFVAHRSQLYAVPDAVSDENALMVEPFASGLHPVLQHFPADDETVLILGAGTIGLCTLAALRALGSQARLLIVARYPFQAEAAQRLGASQVILNRSKTDVYDQVAQHTAARLLHPILGKRVLVGGVDRTFECAGTDAALDDAVRLTRTGGSVILVGVPGIAKGVDWTAIFAQELTVTAGYTYHHAERWNGRTWTTFELALELMASGQVDLGWMVTHRFRLKDYDRAFRLLGQRGNSQVIKAVFEFEPSESQGPDDKEQIGKSANQRISESVQSV